jgi:hypothetical protein
MSYRLGDLPCPYHHGMTLFECQHLHPTGLEELPRKGSGLRQSASPGEERKPIGCNNNEESDRDER